MQRYLILLRAINVGGKNIIKMSELKLALLSHNFENIVTYIQSGNILVNSSLDKKTLQSTIKEIIAKYFNLEIEVFVLTIDDLKSILLKNPFNDVEKNNAYVSILNVSPNKENIVKFSQLLWLNEKYNLDANIVYYYLPNGMGKSKLTNTFLEQKLKVVGTARNINTLEKLLILF